MYPVFGTTNLKLDDKLNDKIKEYLISQYPNEGCGYIRDDEFYPLKNISDKPTQQFEVNPQEWLDVIAEAENVIFVHSHPEWFPIPSEGDMAQQAVMPDVPWIIYGMQKGADGTDNVLVSPPVYYHPKTNMEVPLLGRPFIHAISDCYEIIRSWFWQNKQIELKQFPRSWEWWAEGGDLYSKGFGPAGFRVIDMTKDGNNPMIGDVFLAQVRSPKVINHGGIYIGDGLGLHHVTGRSPFDPSMLSKRDPILRYKPYIKLWVRHESNPAGN